MNIKRKMAVLSAVTVVSIGTVALFTAHDLGQLDESLESGVKRFQI